MCIFTCRVATSGCLKWDESLACEQIVDLPGESSPSPEWVEEEVRAASSQVAYVLPTQQRRWVTHRGGCATRPVSLSVSRSQWMKCLKQSQNNQAASADDLHASSISSRSAELLLLWPRCVCFGDHTRDNWIPDELGVIPLLSACGDLLPTARTCWSSHMNPNLREGWPCCINKEHSTTGIICLKLKYTWLVPSNYSTCQYNMACSTVM